jgi:hypothetical protein
VPKISEFFGIAIYIYYDDHPPPHFHARYEGRWVRIALDGLNVLSGEISQRALGLVREWARLHQSELDQAWEQAMAGQPLHRIEPLE